MSWESLTNDDPKVAEVETLNQLMSVSDGVVGVGSATALGWSESDDLLFTITFARINEEPVGFISRSDGTVIILTGGPS